MLIASRVIDKHSELSGLSSDDHSQYLHTTVQRTVTACHEFRSNGFGVPIVIKRILGQTANLLNIYDDSYALLSYVDKDGNIFGTSFTGNVAGSNITGSISSSVLPSNIAYKDSSNSFTVGDQQITIDANTKKGLTIKAAVLQGVNLLNIINSNSDPLFTVGAGGETLIRSSTLSNVFTIRNSLNTTYIRFDNTNDDTTPRGRLTLNSGSTNKLLLYTDGTDNFIRSDGDLKFNFNGNQRFIFDQSGNLTASGVYYGNGAGLTNLNVNYVASGVIGTTYGGTGLSSYAIGDFIYASGVNALTTLSGNGTATQKVLRMVSGTPSWIDFTLSNLNDAATLNNYALLAGTNSFTAQNTFAAGTITTSQPLTITQTWNNAAVDFTGLLMTVTDTASTSTSYLMIIRNGASDRLTLSKQGTLQVLGTGAIRAAHFSSGGSNTALSILTQNMNSTVTQALTLCNGTYSGANVSQTVVAITPTYNQTGTAGSTDLKIIRTETALGSGTHKLIDCYSGATGTTNVFYVNNDGASYFSSTVTAPAVYVALVRPGGNDIQLTVQNRNITTQTTGLSLCNGLYNASTAISQTAVAITPTINQTGSALGYTALKIAATETAVCGTNRLIDCYAGAAGTANVFYVTNTGGMTLSANGTQGTLFTTASDVLSIKNMAGYYSEVQLGAIRLGNGGDGCWFNTSFQLRSDSAVQWSATTNASSTKDVGLARSSSGVLKITNGSTGLGTLNTGGIIVNLVAKTGNYTLTTTDNIVTSSGTITLTLPTAIGVTGQQYTIKKIDTGTTLTINTTSSQTIDGVTSLSINAQWTSTTVVSDGANWLLI